jgi:predicted ATPase
MRFTVDMLIAPDAVDDFGVASKASITSLQYELALECVNEDGMERMRLKHESLNPIPLGKARRSLGFETSTEFRKTAVDGRRGVPFISTSETGEIIIHQEGHGGRKLPTQGSMRTVISGSASSEFPTILAVRREMESWRSLLLEPSAMRTASGFNDPRSIDARGGNLPAALFRLQKGEDRPDRVRTSVANRLSLLLEDVQELRLREDEKSETRTIELRGRDGVFHPARALSDGTLRFLVLTVLQLDPKARGVLCLEEPENGIHPDRIPAILELLRDLTVDPKQPVDEDNPLRQVIVNTHSPLVVQQMVQNELIYLASDTLQCGNNRGRVVSVRVPPNSWRAKMDEVLPIAEGRLVQLLGNARDEALEMDYHEGEHAAHAANHADH